MKYTFNLLFLIVCFALPGYADGGREKYNFNPGWLVYAGDVAGGEQMGLKDSEWKQVTLPYAWNEDDAFRVAIDQLPTGVAWYRKHFRLPASAKGKKIFLEFEGVRFGGEFYINGRRVGLHENGVMACGLDVTDFVKYGGADNVVAVRTDNDWKYKEKSTGQGYQWNDRNFNANYGGIPKNVWLHVTNRLYQTLPLYSNLKTTGTYIYAREIDITRRRAKVFAESEVRNETGKEQKADFRVRIEDRNGQVVKEFSGPQFTIAAGETCQVKAGARVDSLNFWSWGYGYLYDVYTILSVDGKPVDVVKTRTGFRKTAFRDGMVYLNDRVLQMKGYAQRTSNEWPAVGMSVPAWLSDYSNGLIVEGNGNLVRWMHVTPWKQDVESCDRVGLIQAMPAGDAEKDVTGRRWEQRVDLMRDAIIYNRNNPSILFYESGNESISEEHMAEMKAIRDQYDPYGGRAIGSREMLDSKVAEYGGEMLYINKSARHPMWATEYCRDEASRKYWDEWTPPYHKDGDGPLHKGQDASVYNRNQDSYLIETITRWFDYFSQRPGTGKRKSSGGVNIVFSDSNTHFRGEDNYRRSGEVDAMRIPKDAFFAHQVMWDGWVDVENFRTRIMGHWNYTPEVCKDVLVASSGEGVELFLNGESLGLGRRSKHFLFTFPDVKWKAGELVAVSYDKQHKELSRDTLETTGKPVALRLKAMQAPDGFKADGADLALVEVEVVDSAGRRCPVSNAMVKFDLTGPAEWRGGLAKGRADNYILSKELPVEGGVNRVLLRSLTKTGTIMLTAGSEGLRPASLTLKTVPVKVKNGLSEYISGEHQPSRLGRGATPKTPSYRDTRFSVGITGATAGANEEKAVLSYDDNELSEWTNDGKLATGWITYELERDAEIAEICLKLTGWRMRSYPLQILVDDTEVFRGNTEKSLGYITIPVKPVRGRFVTVRLTGKSEDKDAFGGIVEITGTKELDLYKDPKAMEAKGQLRIVEAEFYEKPRVAARPLYRDPVYDGAADPVVIRNRAENRLFMFYTSRRANLKDTKGVDWVHGSPIGIAESTDGGTTWNYRCDARINYAPGHTYWAPDVVEEGGKYHMFLTVVPGVFRDWKHPREIVHLISDNLIDWDFHSKVPLASEKVIDASVVKGPDGKWRMFYNNEADKKSIYYAVSPDLNTWQDQGKILGQRGEGPKVFRWQDKYFLIMDTWQGQAVFSSDDLLHWTAQPERILENPGTGLDDGTPGLHADVVVSGERAYIFYFTHPGKVGADAKKDIYNTRRSSVQVGELKYKDGKISCDRNAEVSVRID